MGWLDRYTWEVLTLSVLVLGCLLDLLRYQSFGWEKTFSYAVLTKAKRNPIIALLVGILLGHLFWPQPHPPDGQADEPADGTRHP